MNNWQFSSNGHPADVAAELSKYGETLEGAALVHFSEAIRHLVPLLCMNAPESTVKVEAVGTEYAVVEPLI